MRAAAYKMSACNLKSQEKLREACRGFNIILITYRLKTIYRIKCWNFYDVSYKGLYIYKIHITSNLYIFLYYTSYLYVYKGMISQK